MAATPSLFIGSIEIPQTFVEISQTYGNLRGSADTRMADGSLYRRTHWSGKMTSEISVSGVSASSLDGIDFDSSHLLKCVTPIGVISPTVNFTTANGNPLLKNRQDVNAYGKAFVGSRWVDTTNASYNGTDLVLNSVAGATMYKAFYHPQFTALFQDPTEDFSGGVISSWSITCEEI